MALAKDISRIKARGGYLYIRDLSESIPVYRPIGYSGGTDIIWDVSSEEVHDETGEFAGLLVGKNLWRIKPQPLQTSKEELDLVQSLLGKSLALLYLVPHQALGVKKIEVWEFPVAEIKPGLDLKFATSLRQFSMEFLAENVGGIVAGVDMNGSDSVEFENAAMIVRGISGDTALTNIIPAGYKITRIVAKSTGMIAGDKLRIGTTAGGQEVVADVAMFPDGIFDLTIVGGSTTGPTLYAADDGSTTTPWAAAQDVGLYMNLVPV